MWQVCLGQRLHAALAAYHVTTENVRIDLAYATDYRPVTMEQDGSTWTIDLNSVTQINEETASTRRIGPNVLLSWTEPG
jgi:hypothetical protein